MTAGAGGNLSAVLIAGPHRKTGDEPLQVLRRYQGNGGVLAISTPGRPKSLEIRDLTVDPNKNIVMMGFNSTVHPNGFSVSSDANIEAHIYEYEATA